MKTTQVKNNEVPWKDYKSYMLKAEAIYNSVYPEPKSTSEIADKFNKVGNIIRILYST
jgi:hypothetical protein